LKVPAKQSVKYLMVCLLRKLAEVTLINPNHAIETGKGV
jgi:hypothetical protein